MLNSHRACIASSLERPDGIIQLHVELVNEEVDARPNAILCACRRAGWPLLREFQLVVGPLRRRLGSAFDWKLSITLVE